MNDDLYIRKYALMTNIGYVLMLVGAIDPLEGSLLILPGSGLVALGSYLGDTERTLYRYRLIASTAIAFGVAALFGLSALGGFGGESGLSNWWGILILPYLAGWSLSIWGPGVERWVPALGLLVGIWYLVVMFVLPDRPLNPAQDLIAAILTILGAVTIVGCIYRLIAARKPSNSE